MKRKSIKITAMALSFLFVIFVSCYCIARFIFLSPICYSDNANLTDEENYFIKRTVLEAVEDRLSVFGNNGNHVFVCINSDFMNSVIKEDGKYIVRVQTSYMEQFSDDCVYEIYISDDYSIINFFLDA